MLTSVQQRIETFFQHRYPEKAVEKYEADKQKHIDDAMSDAEQVGEVLNDMVFDQTQASLQTDALAFAIVYGRSDDRTIDAFNRLEQAIKNRLGEA